MAPSGQAQGHASREAYYSFSVLLRVLRVLRVNPCFLAFLPFLAHVMRCQTAGRPLITPG
jgi:hypothetical protein